MGVAYQRHGPPNAAIDRRVGEVLAEHQASQPEGCPYVFIPASRYEHIQERRKAGKWTVEDGRSPL